jgi:hypothetical protein
VNELMVIKIFRNPPTSSRSPSYRSSCSRSRERHRRRRPSPSRARSSRRSRRRSRSRSRSSRIMRRKRSRRSCRRGSEDSSRTSRNRRGHSRSSSRSDMPRRRRACLSPDTERSSTTVEGDWTYGGTAISANAAGSAAGSSHHQVDSSRYRRARSAWPDEPRDHDQDRDDSQVLYRSHNNNGRTNRYGAWDTPRPPPHGFKHPPLCVMYQKGQCIYGNRCW